MAEYFDPNRAGTKPARWDWYQHMSERGAEIAIEVVGASVANKTTALGAFTGFAGWLAQVNWLGLVGAFVALLGLLANIYFQHRRDKREQEEREERRWRAEREHQLRMEALKDRCNL